MKPFISLSSRLLVNVEALNMVETIGNVSRHRRATVILQTDDGYRKIEVPCISGESIAHAYQEALIEAAKAIYAEDTIPVCEWCKRGEFFKSMDDAHTLQQVKDNTKGKKGPEFAFAFESEIIRSCIVEDIGGFLRAERPPVKRTSRFQVGYMVPVMDAIKATTLESQFHVRHAPTEAVRGEERAAQMIYYVEVGSAVYGMCFNLDVANIGRTSMVNVKQVIDDDERIRRIKCALTALLILLSSKSFGAKRTRFLPIIEIKSIIASISTPIPFIVEPPTLSSFIENTNKKKEQFLRTLNRLGINEQVYIYAYSSEVEIPEGIERVTGVEELINKLVEKTLQILGG